MSNFSLQNLDTAKMGIFEMLDLMGTPLVPINETDCIAISAIEHISLEENKSGTINLRCGLELNLDAASLDILAAGLRHRLEMAKAMERAMKQDSDSRIALP